VEHDAKMEHHVKVEHRDEGIHLGPPPILQWTDPQGILILVRQDQDRSTPSSSGQLHWGSSSSCGKMMDIINIVSSDSSNDEDSNDVQPVPPPPPKCGKHKALDDEDSNKKVNFNAFM
jgi:hypothetical protein